MIETSDVQFSTWTWAQTPINAPEPTDRTFRGSPKFLTRGGDDTVRVFAGGAYQKSITMGGIRPITVTLEERSLYGRGEWSSIGRVTLDSEQLGFTVQIQTRDRMAGRHMLRYVATNSERGSPIYQQTLNVEQRVRGGYTSCQYSREWLANLGFAG